MSIVYVKGEYVAAVDAKISIYERGFRFGDGLFESIRIAGGQTKHLQRHLRRLDKGLETLRFNPMTESLEEISETLIEKNKAQEGILRLCVSRGIGSQGYLPNVKTSPTIIAELLPLPELSEDPITLWLANWQKPSRKSLPVEAKLMQGVNSTLARLEAQDNNCDEALMLNAQGAICEASSANIFWRTGGLIYTPAVKCGLLPGIAREILLEEMQVQQAAFDLDNLRLADSVMLCNSIRGAMPVYSLQPQGWNWNDDSLATQAQGLLDAA